ncbi:MAG: pilus assembly PilX N-terminal domain-containing protein [Dissulfuribacterales bacterium]
MKAVCKFKEILWNERGVALVTTLILALIGMLMVSSLIYMVQSGIWSSGSRKNYQLALEAAHGGLNILTKDAVQAGIQGSALSAVGNYGGLLTGATTDACFQQKLTQTTSSTNWSSCNLTDLTTPTFNPDVVFTFTFPAPQPNMVVNAKIVNTGRGNSSTSQNVLETGGVESNNSGTVMPQHIPYLYETEVLAQSATNPRERAWLSAIYAY